MENNLYYTPTIEELSINQEVYLLDTGNYKAEYTEGDIYPMLSVITQLTDYPTIWVRNSYNSKGFKTYEVYPDQIGLKYLDQSDIESLGWVLNHTKNSPFTGKDLNTYQLTKEYGFNTGTTYILEQLDNNFYLIKSETYSSYRSEVYRMSFTIFNKSELIKLMQQLNIK